MAPYAGERAWARRSVKLDQTISSFGKSAANSGLAESGRQHIGHCAVMHQNRASGIEPLARYGHIPRLDRADVRRSAYHNQSTSMNVTNDSVPDAMLVSNTVAEIQTLARGFSQPLPAVQAVITIQVAFVAGTANAWRLIETTRSTVGRRRRMLCFDSLEQIQRSVDERLAWQRADEQFVARHMATPGGFPGVTADWVDSKHFDGIFWPSREAIRKEMCATSPKHTMTLS